MKTNRWAEAVRRVSWCTWDIVVQRLFTPIDVTNIYDFTGRYESPGYFPALANNHAKMVKIYREEIYVDRSKLVKGLCPGVKLDVFFPGFPTLKHIPYTSSLRKAKVKVFQQPSRHDSLVLSITDQGKKDVKAVALELLGKSIFVGWPHLIEA
ncbi:unnamed protein product, partial [Timema podura]|nr:unnamed protein product [Timema podura]